MSHRREDLNPAIMFGPLRDVFTLAGAGRFACFGFAANAESSHRFEGGRPVGLGSMADS